MSKFIIQTRKENNQRSGDIGEAIKTLVKGSDSIWFNKGAEFESAEEAKNKCVSMIEKGFHKAENIRVVEVVCEFTSKIIVDVK